MRKRYFIDTLSETQKDTIKQLFNEGNGPQSISIKLKLPSGLVERFLKSVGLTRTMKEAKEIKANCFRKH